MQNALAMTRSLLWTLAIIVGLALVVSLALPRLLGYEVKYALSGSMEPLVMTGDVIWIDPDEQPGVGDVITYQVESGNSATITHRVVAMNTGTERTYITAGDATGSIDREPVRDVQVVGVVTAPLDALGDVVGLDLAGVGPFSIPKLGYLLQHLPAARPYLFFAAAALVLWMATDGLRRPRTPRTASEPRSPSSDPVTAQN